ncbi:dGTPase [Pseudomonas marginalis]|uniref:dGTPase n=2 Tax=Pseudomonas marginalis TaxID=298 RepID=UPI002B1D0C12|nr:dGTPase [Pseudomonas marginalis]
MSSIYGTLLSSMRFRPSEVEDRNTLLLEAESDRGRLLFCPAFRRLQQKAQVFSMEPNAAVRSRLTHSIEVAQTGRYIADRISLKLIEANLASRDECAALTVFVETACLMHDIGNPPFGHFGESAISEWFRENGKLLFEEANKDNGLYVNEAQSAAAIADFLEFDGNPQGIRVVTKLQRNIDEFGLNLTKTTIAAYLKYIRGNRQSYKSIDSPFTKKCGYFSTEEQIVLDVWSEFNYNSPQRFPLAYIMEAADDIAYCISDLEDSIEKGLLVKSIAFEEIRDDWLAEGMEGQDSDRIDKILRFAAAGERDDGRKFTFTDFRTSLNRLLVEFAANQYIEFHDSILSGKLPSLIPSDTPAGKILDALKGYCRKKVYCHESVQRIELAGYRAIYGLLDHFSCLLVSGTVRFRAALDYKTKDAKGRSIIIENKLLTLFPKNYIQVYKEQLEKIESVAGYTLADEWVLRAHLITDFISGMTDDFATTSYQNLSGMRI